MTKNEFIHILRNSPKEEIWKAIKNAEATFSDKELFGLYVFLLSDPQKGVRFSALYQLIDKFPKRLSKSGDELANLMIKLLIDEFHPIVDRAAWALSIMGEVGLNKLLENANSKNLYLRTNVIWAIGRNSNLHLRKVDVIELLTNGLQDENEDIRFFSRHSLREVTPINE